MMKALGIGDSRFRGFIRKLSELRNQAVHNVEQTNLDLKVRWAGLSDKELSDWAETLGGGIRGCSSQHRLHLFKSNPKRRIYLSALNLIAVLALHKSIFATQREIAAFDKQLSEYAQSVIQAKNERRAKRKKRTTH